MTTHWAMLADDLTGACDAGVAFAVAGFRTSVVWREDLDWPEDAEMLVVSTETRAARQDEAREKIRVTCARLAATEAHASARALGRCESGRVVIYKKIDSVLRGPVATEIRAVMDHAGFRRAVVCPALPEHGRTVGGGRVFVHGEPLEAGLPAGGGIETPDAATVEDLRVIAAALARELGRTLAVGSAGLALELARALGSVGTKPPPASPGSVAVVIGSHHAVTLAQLDYLRGAGTILETTPDGLERIGQDAFTAVVMREVDETAFEPLGRAVEAGRIGAVIATGGATARVMLNGMGARAIELCGEVERGVPWGRVRGGRADGALLVTKSGGFGSPDCLWRAWRALRPETTK
jgi:uncharacterized protein YgbK (DUF1537 family)